ncbi:DNA-binding transcriptional ArsR family regulator [Methanococcus voltae PS]|uniref:DNA-binding transcriptional ArsR family regulator n=1 Tax=Methanococcus voltae PS TaxID=523842 RepID=A0ABT2EYS6_METVO|nr:winged helix-turn-helix domain-containing protein [Methanococcus voltae]MCS3922120.1 DNA-binding transcriptional ArsR family regulator [Methanococcus voltae PS]
MRDNDEYLSELKSIKEELKALKKCLIEYINISIKNNPKLDFENFSELDFEKNEITLENQSNEFKTFTDTNIRYNETYFKNDNLDINNKYITNEYTIKISEISEKEVIEVFEPLSNERRLIILNSLLTSDRTYSELSNITGIRGGNLLFHLRKLQCSKLISQNHDRGDYILTSKGQKILSLIYQVYYIIRED